jgi:hypothetical protein
MRHKPLKRTAKLIRIEIAEQAAEGVVTGKAVSQGEKAAQKRLLASANSAISTAPWPPHNTQYKAIISSS